MSNTLKNVLRLGSTLALAIAVGSTFGGCSDEKSSGANGGAGGGDSDGSAAASPDGAVDGADAGADTMRPPCPELSDLSRCGTVGVQAEIRTANILLVIDRSGSMNDTPTGFATNKWSALKTALQTALTEVADDINFGLLLYPFSTAKTIPVDCAIDECCLVPPADSVVRAAVEIGTASVPKINAELEKTAPGGGTPTAAALKGAYDYFTTGAGAALQGDKYVLLATDGGPNCNSSLTCGADRCTPNLDGACFRNPASCCDQLGALCLDDQSVIAQVSALSTAGIPTFVVGIPGTEAYANYLDPIAVAGGKPAPAGSARRYYEVSAQGGVQGLVDVFRTITTQLVRSCDIVLTTSPPDKDKVNVAVDCKIVPQGQDGAFEWEIDTTTDPPTLRFKGMTCANIQQNGADRVDVVYGCPPIK